MCPNDSRDGPKEVKTVMAKLAINGGEKVRTKPWPTWPVWDEREIKALEEVVRSGHWGRLYEGSKVEQFEKEFAAYQDARFGLAVTSDAPNSSHKEIVPDEPHHAPSALPSNRDVVGSGGRRSVLG